MQQNSRVHISGCHLLRSMQTRDFERQESNNNIRKDLDSVSKNAPPEISVRYGDEVRLWAHHSKYISTSNSNLPANTNNISTNSINSPASNNSNGGYVGWYDSGRVFRSSANPDKQGDIVCIPPLKSEAALLYHEARFVVTSNSLKRNGAPLLYGDEIILVDQRNYVWNNKIGIGPTSLNGCIGPRERYTRGEMFISLESNDITRNQRPVYYGDKHISIQVVDSHRVRKKFNQRITLFRDMHNSPCGYLCSDGRGKDITFEIHGESAPSVLRVELIRGSERILLQRRVPWGEQILLPSLSKEGIILLHLSDGGKVQIDQKTIVNSGEELFWELCQNSKRPARVEFQSISFKSKEKATEGIEPVAYKYPTLGLLVALLLCFWNISIGAILLSLIGVLIVKTNSWAIISTYRWLPFFRMFANESTTERWKLTPLAWEASPSERFEAEVCCINEPDLLPCLDIPKRFIIAEEGDIIRAKNRWAETLQWRAEQDIDKILEEKHDKFAIIKRYSCHFLHKKDKLGHPVYIEQLGTVNLKELRALGVDLNDLFRHYIFNMEFIFQYIATEFCQCDSCKSSETCKLLIILDIQGTKMRDFVGEILEYIRGCTTAMQKHYPQRSYKIFLINVPSWFGLIWKVIKTFLNETTKAKTYILAENEVQRTLLEFIPPENLPVPYGGTCSCEGGCSTHSQEEKLERQLVDCVMKGQSISNLYLDQDKMKKVVKSDFSLCSVRIESYVLKKSRKQPLNPLWQKRYAILEGQTLKYGKSPKCSVYRTVNLTHDTLIHNVVSKNNCLEIITPLLKVKGRSLLFQFDTSYSLNQWIIALKQVVDTIKT